MRSARAILALVRWRNALLAAAGVLLGAWWADGAPFTLAPLLAALSAIALASFANAFNDVCDRDIDLLAHPERPLPRGELRLETALATARFAAIVGVAAAALARPVLGVVSVGVVALMHAYSRSLAARGALGNAVVAVLASLPFLYGAWSVGAPAAALPLLALAIPLHFAREVAKDLEDAHADSAARRTLPFVLGSRGARGVFILALLVFVAVLARFALARPLFALLVLPALALCAAATWCVVAERRGSAVLLKSAMLWAMAALVVGAS